MDRPFAIELLKRWFGSQHHTSEGKHQVLTAPVWRSRDKVRVHNAWLIAVEDEDGSNIIQNITAAVAAAMGLKYDRKTGGIPSPATWLTIQQVQQLGQLLDLTLKHDVA